MLYNANSYEVWGNAKDGYDVNNIHTIERKIEIPDNIEDSELKKLVKATFAIAVPLKKIEIVSDTDGYFTFNVNGKPLGEFVASNEK